MSGVGLGGGSWIGSGGGGPITGTPQTFAGFNALGILSSAPEWTWQNTGTYEAAFQNSSVIASGITDYSGVAVTNQINNLGLTNLNSFTINSDFQNAVANFYAFSSFCYGASAPTSYVGFQSSPNWLGVGQNVTHFNAGGVSNFTDSITVLNYSTASQADSFYGVLLSPNTATFSDLYAFQYNGSANTSDFHGVSIAPLGNHLNAYGIEIDLSQATITNRPIGLSLTNGSIQAASTFQTTSNAPFLVDNGNLIRPTLQVVSGSPITGTDFVMNNFSGFIDAQDNMDTSALGLGVVATAAVSQIAVASTKTLRTASMCLGAAAVDASSAGGTVTDLQLFDALAINQGGTLTVTNLYGFRMQSHTSDVAVNTWGFCVDDSLAENYLQKSLKIGGGGTKKVTHSSIALELDDAKSFRLALLTTAQRTALPNIAGTMVFDSTTSKAYYNDGGGWHQM